jgi:photosynthetic reaction center H subunit
MLDEIMGRIDLAAVAIWGFWLFFAGLIYYIQRENMREGYPLENDDGSVASNQGPFPVPEDKTFILPHGRGEVTVPSGQRPDRQNLPLRQTSMSNGYPFEPTGDPMIDGVGPASWANRRDVPELDGHGHPKIVPMSKNDAFQHAAGNDPRGMQVIAGDGEMVGTVTDMWIDAPEQLVRYLEISLDPKWGEGTRLVPMTMARIWTGQCKISSIYGKHFAAVPQLASSTQITLLEEEKVSAYYGGGHLYADEKRLEPQL